MFSDNGKTLRNLRRYMSRLADMLRKAKIKHNKIKNRYIPIIIIAIVVLVSIVLYLSLLRAYSYKIFWETNIRYLVSALLQCEATILAIVVSSTFLGVQLAAQKYTQRVIEIFVRDKYFLIILLLYFSAISFGVLLLYMLPDGKNAKETITLLNKEFSFWVFNYIDFIILIFSVFIALTSAAFYFLKYYIEHVLNLLKPEKIIAVITNEIKDDKIISYGFQEIQTNPLYRLLIICMNITNERDSESSIACAKYIGDKFDEVNNLFINKYLKYYKYYINSNKTNSIFDSDTLFRSYLAYEKVVELFTDSVKSLFLVNLEKEMYLPSEHYIRTLENISKAVISTKIFARSAYVIIDKLNNIYEVINDKIHRIYKYNRYTDNYVHHELLRLLTSVITSIGNIASYYLENIKDVNNDEIIISKLSRILFIDYIINVIESIIEKVCKNTFIVYDSLAGQKSIPQLNVLSKILCDLNVMFLNNVQANLDRIEKISDLLEKIVRTSVKYKFLSEKIKDVWLNLWKVSYTLYDNKYPNLAISTFEKFSQSFLTHYKGYILNKSEITKEDTYMYYYVICKIIEKLTEYITFKDNIHDDFIRKIIDFLVTFNIVIKSKNEYYFNDIFVDTLKLLVYYGTKLLERGDTSTAYKIAFKIISLINGKRSYLNDIWVEFELYKNSNYETQCIELTLGEEIPIEKEFQFFSDKLYGYFQKFKRIVLNLLESREY